MNEQSDNPAADLEVPEQLRYSDDHVWVDDSLDPAMIGITEYAVDQMGELVYVDLPEVGERVEAGDEIIELESSKAVSELYSPVTGTVTAVNDALRHGPGAINTEPYESGWIFKVDVSEDAELLDAEGYAEHIA